MLTGNILLPALIDRLDTGVLIQGAQAEMLHWNQAVLDLLGVTEDELSGRTSFDPEWNVIHLDGSDFPGPTHPVPVALATEKSVQNVIMGVWRPRTKDRIWLLVNADPLFHDDRSLACVLCTFSDISDRIRFEKRRNRLVKAAVFEKAAGGIVHDMKNLLASIQGYSDLAKLQLPNRHPVLEPLHGIDGVVEQGAKLSQKLIDLAVEDTRETEVFDLNGLILDMSGLLRSLLGEPIALQLHLSREKLFVHAHRTDIQQIILNLVVNARDAMARGGILSIDTSSAKADSGMSAVLVVNDTGHGIAADTLPHIFDLYYTSRTDGSGLGLATCKDIVRNLGGSITATSTPEEGASFEVRIPIAASRRSDTSSQRDSLTPRAREGERILLVEDNPSVRNITEGMLLSLGYEVDSCTNGQEALERVGEIDLAEQGYTAVLTDLLMPRIDGLEFASKLEERGLGIPLVIATAESLSSQERLRKSRYPVLWKPFRYNALAQMIRSAIDAD